MTEEELLKIFSAWANENDAKHGDMSDFSDAEVKFICFKGGFEYASGHLTPTASDRACTCGKHILGSIPDDEPCPVAWHNPPRA